MDPCRARELLGHRGLADCQSDLKEMLAFTVNHEMCNSLTLLVFGDFDQPVNSR